eukprot:358352-Chlamydomonas_euryale.AAC.2
MNPLSTPPPCGTPAPAAVQLLVTRPGCPRAAPPAPPAARTAACRRRRARATARAQSVPCRPRVCLRGWGTDSEAVPTRVERRQNEGEGRGGRRARVEDGACERVGKGEGCAEHRAVTTSCVQAQAHDKHRIVGAGCHRLSGLLKNVANRAHSRMWQTEHTQECGKQSALKNVAWSELQSLSWNTNQFSFHAPRGPRPPQERRIARGPPARKQGGAP